MAEYFSWKNFTVIYFYFLRLIYFEALKSLKLRAISELITDAESPMVSFIGWNWGGGGTNWQDMCPKIQNRMIELKQS